MHDIWDFFVDKPQTHNLTKEEWNTIRKLGEDHSIVIKPAGKESGIVVWD